MPPDLVVTDLVGLGDDLGGAADLDRLLALHRKWFDDHPHVQPELVDNARLPSRRGHLVVHQFLATVRGEAAGFAVVHANLRQQVGLIHFLAVEPDFRRYPIAGRNLPHHLVDLACAQVQSDGVAFGRPIVHGTVAESDADLVDTWGRFGFTELSTDYAEPYHGMHWAEHGPATFFDMTLVGRDMRDGPAAAARAAATAFLVDHYRLPVTHPRVVLALASG